MVLMIVSTEILHLMPEILLAFGVLSLLLVGVFRRVDAEPAVSWSLLAVFIVVGVLIEWYRLEQSVDTT